MDQFEKLINEAISKAQKIRCTFGEYVAGLRAMSEHLRDVLSLAEEEEEALGGPNDE